MNALCSGHRSGVPRAVGSVDAQPCLLLLLRLWLDGFRIADGMGLLSPTGQDFFLFDFGLQGLVGGCGKLGNQKFGFVVCG